MSPTDQAVDPAVRSAKTGVVEAVDRQDVEGLGWLADSVRVWLTPDGAAYAAQLAAADEYADGCEF